MTVEFRVIDTGVRGGRANIAFDQALIGLRQTRDIPDTIRFLQFRPSVLVGRHQILTDMVDLDYCVTEGIEVGRRVTGGGALYLDTAQFGWELVFHRSHLGVGDLTEVGERLCRAAAAGLSTLGAAVAFRPRNDLEIDGRKVGGTGGFFDGEIVFFQGTVLLACDYARMGRALRVPAAKAARHTTTTCGVRMIGLSEVIERNLAVAEAQVALLRGLCAGLGVNAVPGAVLPAEEALAAHLLAEEIGTPAFIDGVAPREMTRNCLRAEASTLGGQIRIEFMLEGSGERRIAEALLSGDFFVTPPRAVFDLEARLRGLPVAEVPAVIEAEVAASGAVWLGFTAGDLAQLAARALGLVDMAARTDA